MHVSRYVLQDPNATVRWQNDWTAFLGENESISSRVWSISPMLPGTPLSPVLANETTAIVSVSGLEAGKVYHLTERATMLSGSIEEQTIVIRCEHT